MSEMTIITDLSQVPDFESKVEEATFWAAHAFAPDLLNAENAVADDLLPPVRPRKSNPTSLRLSADLESRLRHLALLKQTSYQTLLKEFVLERVYEEEKRLRVI
ncbi:CopG family antitoxin [Deinococcus alpinitundrae]|uniref:CopG family antitoxin n=1 Tax=Deinococcus alpinitundrae TaxID=468913 RepID=UPI001379F74C|nr:CopG family antitoxin [Deinococcus alpinitundrae]